MPNVLDKERLNKRRELETYIAQNIENEIREYEQNNKIWEDNLYYEQDRENEQIEQNLTLQIPNLSNEQINLINNDYSQPSTSSAYTFLLNSPKM